MTKIPPALFLFFFAPLPVEYVSGSSPYLNPFVWLGNFLLYGAGTILIRELKVRWRKGWLAIFILSAAYMIAEEGLMLNTLFDPTRNTAGRAWGVNWVWTAGMFVIHSLMGIFVPILLAEAIYHKKADEPWVKPRTAFVLLLLFCANVFGLGRLIAPSNRPSALHYLAEAVIIGACLWLAQSVPGPRRATLETTACRSPRWLYVTSLIGMLVTMVAGFAAPALPLPAIAQAAIMLTVYAVFLVFLNRYRAFDPGLDPLSQFAVASGAISLWILISPLVAFGKGSVGPVAFAALVTYVLLIALKSVRVATRETKS
jgi:hypothetical protein